MSVKITYHTRLLLLMQTAEKACGEQLSNSAICTALGFASHASASRIVRETAAAGLIRIDLMDSNNRTMALTDLGRQRLAGVTEIQQVAAETAVVRQRKHASITELPSVGDIDERAARKAAANSNDRFLAALAKVAPVADAIDRDKTSYRRLPPPALSGQSFT